MWRWIPGRGKLGKGAASLGGEMVVRASRDILCEEGVRVGCWVFNRFLLLLTGVLARPCFDDPGSLERSLALGCFISCIHWAFVWLRRIEGGRHDSRIGMPTS